MQINHHLIKGNKAEERFKVDYPNKYNKEVIRSSKDQDKYKGFDFIEGNKKIQVKSHADSYILQHFIDGGWTNPIAPYTMGCQATHFGIYYNETSPLYFYTKEEYLLLFFKELEYVNMLIPTLHNFKKVMKESDFLENLKTVEEYLKEVVKSGVVVVNKIREDTNAYKLYLTRKIH